MSDVFSFGDERHALLVFVQVAHALEFVAEGAITIWAQTLQAPSIGTYVLPSDSKNSPSGMSRSLVIAHLSFQVVDLSEPDTFSTHVDVGVDGVAHCAAVIADAAVALFCTSAKRDEISIAYRYF